MRIIDHCINKDNMAYWGCPKNTMREMDFERDYMPGNVAGEMGDCREIEALKAQAIVGRSYALQYILKGAAIYDTSKAQVFSASRAASKNYLLHRQAAEDTAGIIVTYNGKPCNTHYSHSNGGYVQKSSNKWEPGGYADPWDDGKKSGHGSGMSQVGAENMAKAGKTYQEILAFYYPGTALMNNYGKAVVEDSPTTETEVEIVENVNKIIAYARAQVRKPYKLGASGPDEFDCSGLTKRAVQQIGLDWYHGASTQWKRGSQSGKPTQYGYWKASGTIDTMPENEVCFLFNRDKAKPDTMAHVAIYDPAKKTVIQAGGYLGKGVHENPFKDCRRYFTHWATLRDAGADSPVKPQEPQEAAFPTLRKGSEGESVKTLQTLLNASGAGLVVDGKFGPMTYAAVKIYQEEHGLKADGIVGSETWGSLLADELEETEEPATVSLLLSGLTVEQADEVIELAGQYPNVTVEKQS
jgi:cell wall-associated NlpC family hydrolase